VSLAHEVAERSGQQCEPATALRGRHATEMGVEVVQRLPNVRFWGLVEDEERHFNDFVLLKWAIRQLLDKRNCSLLVIVACRFLIKDNRRIMDR